MSTRSGSEARVVLRPPERIAGDEPRWVVHRHELAARATARDRGAARPVLLIHAATLGREMFAVPGGGLIAHLLRQSEGRRPLFDVFTLDWRSSNLLFGNLGEGAAGGADDYRVERVAEIDVPEGIEAVAALHPGQAVHVVAHCMGAAATAQAIASGSIGAAGAPGRRGPQPPLGQVVLATIGLFYRLGVDGWLKVADDIIGELEARGVGFLSPHAACPEVAERCRWPRPFERMFGTWRRSVFAHGCRSEFCDRLWFLYGGDYRADDMMTLHDDRGRAGLTGHFGAMPIGLYRHIVDNCRRGWAARWDPASPADDHALLAAERFRGKHLTLITGAENQVWHRDSIDRMYEWLRRELGLGAEATVRKRVFERYGHVDLWWSSEAPREVFPYLTSVLGAPVAGDAAARAPARRARRITAATRRELVG